MKFIKTTKNKERITHLKLVVSEKCSLVHKVGKIKSLEIRIAILQGSLDILDILMMQTFLLTDFTVLQFSLLV